MARDACCAGLTRGDRLQGVESSNLQLVLSREWSEHAVLRCWKAREPKSRAITSSPRSSCCITYLMPWHKRHLQLCHASFLLACNGWQGRSISRRLRMHPFPRVRAQHPQHASSICPRTAACQLRMPAQCQTQVPAEPPKGDRPSAARSVAHLPAAPLLEVRVRALALVALPRAKHLVVQLAVIHCGALPLACHNELLRRHVLVLLQQLQHLLQVTTAAGTIIAIAVADVRMLVKVAALGTAALAAIASLATFVVIVTAVRSGCRSDVSCSMCVLRGNFSALLLQSIHLRGCSTSHAIRGTCVLAAIVSTCGADCNLHHNMHAQRLLIRSCSKVLFKPLHTQCAERLAKHLMALPRPRLRQLPPLPHRHRHRC